VWLLSQQDWSAIADAVGELSLWQVLLSIFLIGIRHLFNTLRWVILVRAQEILLSYREGLRLVFSGLFVSNFLPSMVGGDVIRIAGLLSKTENRVAGAASVVVDRLIGAIGMLVAIPLSIPLFVSILEKGSLAGTFAAGFGTRFADFVRSAFSRLSIAVKLWTSQPDRLFLSLLSTWASMLVNFVAIWILATGLGISVSLAEVAGASAITYYLTIIPLSINGYGIRELAIVGLYTQLGSTTEQASALALITRFVFMLVSLLGVVWVGKVLEYSKTDVSVDLESESD
jgi:uncharacterized membrane protein YbhN (UPF0104 family)